jgi:hypothetical protein
MMRTPLRLVLGLAVLLLVWVTAGPASAQSPFAVTNIGQRVANDDARMVGRGGWGMAVSDSLNPGFKNLASLYRLRYLALKFTGYGDNMEATDTQGERKIFRAFSPDIRVAGPVFKDRLALTAGFQVHRSTQYHTYIDTTWAEVWGDSVVGNDQYVRTGNRFRVPLGGAFKLFPGLAVSGALNIEGGGLTGTVNNFFVHPADNQGPYYQPNIKETYDEFHGNSRTWGILIDPVWWVQLGASWTPAHKVEANRRVTHFGVSERYETTYTMQMPDEYMAGIQVQPFKRLRLGADGQFQEFSKFTGPEVWMADMEDEYTLSAGLERTQGHVRRGGWSNVPIRFGATFRRWAYRVGGEPVDEKWLNLGTGFPFGHNLGELDVALSYGIIGELEKNGLETTIWRLTISVTGLERWW